jgi:branched-chain amino acid transport system substrate-binding protein
VAQNSQDVVTTGSIKTNDAQEVTPPSPLPSPEAEKTSHTDTLASSSDTASPPATALASPSALAPSSAPTSSAPASLVMTATARGVTDKEVRLGISAPLTGPAKELGRQMKLGIEAAFNSANEAGGVHGRQLKLISADDGYEPTRTAETVRQLHEKHQILGFVGNVGTPTGAVALPYALENKLLFFGAFTGANLFRAVPPDRYVFNYRASYAEETEAVVRYLVKVRGLRPSEIAVFAQQDAYGDDGFAGVAKALRALQGGSTGPILRLNYQRNSVDVAEAVAQLRAHQSVQQPAPNAKTKASPKQTSTDARPGTDAKGIANSTIKAMVMIPAYRAAAKFIELTRPLYSNMIYTNVSFVGSTALKDELKLLGPTFMDGVIVTQVVPAVEGHSKIVLDYKAALAKYFPGEAPDYVSLEGYVAAQILAEALKRAGPQLDTEKLVDTLESIRGFYMGLGTLINFGPSEHQGSHKVWGTQLDKTGRFNSIDLE